MLFQNALLFLPDGHFRLGDMRVNGEWIAEIGEKLSLLPGEEALDCGRRKLAPGLIDIHTHGCRMHDFCEGTEEAFEAMAACYIENGITTVCPTSMTLPVERLEEIYLAYARWIEKNPRGARMIGINMEGPFISVAKKGAHEAGYIVPADIESFKRLWAASGGRIRLCDAAPEIPGNLDFIREAKDFCTISIAHTAGSYEEVIAGFEAGAKGVTHLFNGMSGFSHRSPGCPGAAFDRAEYAELICDGEHVLPPVLRAAVKLLGPERLVVISDSVTPAGMPEGTRCTLGGEEVAVRGGRAELPDGTIAGSIVNLLEEVRRLIGFGIPEETALLGCTRNPARAIGAGEIGELAAGKRADLLLLGYDYRPVRVYRDGVRYS